MAQFKFFLVLLVAMGGGWWGKHHPTAANAKPLKIGVPANSPWPKYVNVKCNRTQDITCYEGFSIEVFQLILKRIGYQSPYEFFPYNGTYDSLVKQVYHKEFDAVVGDVSIVAYRTKYVEFSRHYTEFGLRMVVCEESKAGKAWMFVKPFTKTLWALTGAIFLYNGLLVWLIEKASCNEDVVEGGSFYSQIGSLFWLSFTTLFPIHGKKLRSNLSRVAMVVWLFVALVLTQSYTASLTSMLTVRQLRPSVLDVESLKKSRAKVGCDVGSFSESYLGNALKFEKSLIKTYKSGEEFAQALRSGEIKAAFLELAVIKFFLDDNKGFTVTGPIFEIGGYGFAFSKDSHLVGKVSLEILKLRESGELHKLEEHLVSSHSKSLTESKNGSLSPDSFWGLFLITGGTSTLAFLLFQVSRFYDNWRRKKQPQAPWLQERICVLIPASSKIVPQMVTGTAPDRWHNPIQVHEFRRSNTL